MVDQLSLWQQVESIKGQVRAALTDDLPHDFRASNVYQNYTAMCGEAFWAHKDNELDEDIVLMLHDAAVKVIEQWNIQRGTHAQSQTN